MYRLCALAFRARIDGTPQCADTLIGLPACHGWSSTHGAKAPDAEGTKTTRKQLDELIKADSLASDLNAEDRDNASLHQDVEAAGWSGTVSAEVPADESLGVKGRLEQVIVKKAHIGFCWGHTHTHTYTQEQQGWVKAASEVQQVGTVTLQDLHTLQVTDATQSRAYPGGMSLIATFFLS